MRKFFSKGKMIVLLVFILMMTANMSFAASMGDVNGSNNVDILDALMIAQYSVGLNPTGFISSVANVDCNGSINVVDALIVAQYYVKLITQFPCTPTPTPTQVQTKTPTATPTTGPIVVKGSEILVIGESFIAMSHEITRFLQTSIRNAGIIGSSESIRDNSVSGMRLAGGGSPTIPQQYANGASAGQVRYVVMDGGGNDCLGGSCSNPPTSSCTDLQNAYNAAKNLLTKMGNDGVRKVVWFWYPDPQQDLGGLQAKLNVLRPMIQGLVEGSTNPKCYWLDLRPVFAGKYSQYITGDGIHPTSAGCQATADAVWALMKQVNFFGN